VKRTLGTLVASVAIALGLLLPGNSASAQTATTGYATKFTTAITYQNIAAPGTQPATIRLQLYADGSTQAITVNLNPLAAGAGTSVAIGDLQATGLNAGFQGGAVMSSDQPIVATMVQVPVNSAVINRPLSNGFSPSEGSATVLLATILKNKFNYTSKFSVQNVDSLPANVTIEFFNAESNPIGQKVHTETITGLVPGSVKYFDLGTLAPAAFGSSFNGSATIKSVRTGAPGTPGKMVATVMELSFNSTGARAFEGVSGGGRTFYMPSAQCQAFGTSSAYAVQNTSTTAATNVTVTYLVRPASNPAAPLVTRTETFTNLAPGAKRSFVACAVVEPGFFGSAKIQSTAADIVAIAKIEGSGVTTAAPGVSQGAPKLAFPYVRWANDAGIATGRQRGAMAIQNIGRALNAGEVTVTYYDKNGAVVGTHALGAIPTDAKVNSNPTLAAPAAAPPSGATLGNFGYYADGTFGGSAVISGPADSRLVAVIRVQSFVGGGAGEDYNGIPVP
jgi:hypothetical protein